MIIKISPAKDKPGFFVVTPSGPIDNSSYQEFSSKLKTVLSPEVRGVVIDLAQVDYISSAGLGVIFSIKKSLMERNASLVFCHLKPQIVKLFEIVKALPKEGVFKDMDEADRYFYSIMNEEIRKNRSEKRP